ncbi:MAG: TolC family protein [Microscillaceae bacterium]|nr:TolC family protein [Microscillaceae bacterium]
MKRILILFVCLVWASYLLAQPPTLRLEDALAKSLSQNVGLQIQQLETTSRQNDVFKANAGRTLTLDIIGNAFYANNFADVRLRTFQPVPPEFITVSEVGVENLQADIGLRASHLLYDAGKSKYRFLLLENLSALEKAKQQTLINATLLQTALLYLEVLKLENQLDFLEENIATSQQRIQKMEDQLRFGKAVRLDVLLLKNALNEDEAQRDALQLAQNNLRADLNNLMGEDLSQAFILEMPLSSVAVPALEALITDIEARNPSLKLQKSDSNIAQQQLRLSQLENAPTVSAYAQAGYLYQKNDVQQLARLQSLGLTVGLNVFYNLRDGGVWKNRRQNAQIQTEIKRFESRQLMDELGKEALQTRNKMLVLQSQLLREQANQQAYDEAYQKTQDLFLAGKTNHLALREAQLARLNNILRTEDVRIDTLKAYFQLLHLSGNLTE